MATEAIENQTSAARLMERFASRRWMASLVISVRIASVGTIMTFTRKAAVTEEKPSARPASGCRPMLT